MDAKVPAENIVVSHYVAESQKWFAASEGSDGSVHLGFGNTEPLARRIAGLRTFEHLKARADGSLPALTSDEIEAARLELAVELLRLEEALQAHNGTFSEVAPKEVILIQVRAARDLVNARASRGTLAKWVAPLLLFLAGGFVDGILGVYAEKALEALNKVLAG